MKPVWQSRTVWFNVLTAASAVFLLPEAQALLGPDAMQYVVMGSSIINVVLRLLTVAPVTVKV